MDHDVVRRLVDAVNAGGAAGVEEALTLGADPNMTAGRFQGSVLSSAVGSGDVRIVRLLLDAGASAGPIVAHAWSPLRAAVQEGHPDVAEALIERGTLAAEPVVRGSVLADSVAYAMYRPRPAALETLRLLLRSGASAAPGEEVPIVAAVMQVRRLRCYESCSNMVETRTSTVRMEPPSWSWRPAAATTPP
jgi:uncharacterized protein